MNGICKHCGRAIDWCNCEIITSEGHARPNFEPSGFVAVPKDFIDAVKQANENKPPFYAYGDNEAAVKMSESLTRLVSMLSEIEGKE